MHSAEAAGIPVSHPIIDRIRACSSTPDSLAADFFLCLLCPEASNRATAVSMRSHPYCHLLCLQAHVAFLQRLLEEKGAKIRAAQGTLDGLVKVFFAQLFRTIKSVHSDQDQQAGASQHRKDESGDSCCVSFATSVSAKTDRVSSATAASSSQSSPVAAAASRSGLILAVTTFSSARRTPQTRQQQPPRSAAVCGLSTKFVAAVDEEGSSLIFGFPGAPGGSDGDVGGGRGANSDGRAQQKASSPPAAASVK